MDVILHGDRNPRKNLGNNLFLQSLDSSSLDRRGIIECNEIRLYLFIIVINFSVYKQHNAILSI